MRLFLRPFLRSLLFPCLSLNGLKWPSGVTLRITPDALKLLYFRELTTQYSASFQKKSSLAG